MLSNVANQEKVDHVTRFLERRLGHMPGCHDYRETMAHTALLAALVVALLALAANDWPARWGAPIYIPGRLATFPALVGSWLFIHWYMRWRLRNRRFAARLNASLLNVLRRWAKDEPSMAEITPATEGIPQPSPAMKVIDFFFPLERATVVREDGLRGYPIAVVEEFANTTTRAIRAERVASLASLFLFVWAVVSML
jgi:hypothetical protein